MSIFGDDDPFAGLDHNLGGERPAKAASHDELRRGAHVLNGGESTHACPRCHGTGRWRGYARTFPCNECGATGKVTARVAGAAKGMETREKNLRDKRNVWGQAHPIEEQFIIQNSNNSEFLNSLRQSLDTYGSLTDNQLAAVRRNIQKFEDKRAEFKARDEAKSGEVDVSAIMALFDRATNNDIKRPVFRADGLELSLAPKHGNNPGAIYVKSKADDAYLGKIAGGKFHASRAATEDTLETLRNVATDPTAAAIKYARRTGNCGCCGRELVDPVSIRAGIGPICATKWGLDYRRELARDELAEEK